MEGHERRRAEKREKMLKAASELIFTRNIRDVGIREIAEKAGVSPVSIYNYFGSKENLAREVFFEYMNRAAREFLALIDDDSIGFREKAEKYMGLGIGASDQISAEAMAPDAWFWDDPQVAAFREEYAREKALPALQTLIAQGRTEGAIPELLSMEVVLAYIGAFQQLTRSPQMQDKGKRREFSHLFFYGLFGKPE